MILEIPGSAVPQPRPRFRSVMIHGKQITNAYVPKKHPVHLWRHAVVDAWRDAGRQKIDGAVAVSIAVLLRRPQRIVWKRRPMPAEWATTGGDADNLAKPVLDALTGRAWDDDVQVVSLRIAKAFVDGTEEPRTLVSIDPAPTVVEMFGLLEACRDRLASIQRELF